MGQVILVRHGQASWGTADYDVLSERGHEQAAATGRALATMLPEAPDLVVHGTMRRQTGTAQELARAAGWSSPLQVDERWNEMDHQDVVEAQPREEVPGHETWADEPDKHQFQAWFELATERWTGGQFDDEYDEPFGAFRSRTRAALDAVVDTGTVVAVTSGGPIASLTTELIGADLSTYRHLTVVVANASLTRIVSGRRGVSLVSFNECGHLLGDPGRDLLSYR